MLQRFLLNDLKTWSQNKYRKPLILRGARQVGKTTLVSMFSRSFEQYIYLNLDLAEDASIFSRNKSFEQLIEAIFYLKDKSHKKQTLIFIDEIQNSPQAVAFLRYFYEKRPDLYVIAAGSLLESLLDVNISFPVGRVEFMVLRPFTFEEFLWALNENKSVDLIHTIPCPEYAHEKLAALFHRYLQVGGMPEAIKIYAESNDLRLLASVYKNLIIAYQEDVEKYAPKDRLVPIVRHVIQTAFAEVGTRIKYTGFGNSQYRSKDIKEALNLLQKAFLFNVFHPVTQPTLPLSPNTRKAPRIQTLDTGLVLYMTNTQHELYKSDNISAVFSGRIAEHIVGQELLAQSNSPLHTIHFWTREKSQSNAEVDFVVVNEGQVIPIEVKSGSSGSLRSLHSFIDSAPHDTAIRIYEGKFSIEKNRTIKGKPYCLVNLPFYLAGKINQYVSLR